MLSEDGYVSSSSNLFFPKVTRKIRAVFFDLRSLLPLSTIILYSYHVRRAFSSEIAPTNIYCRSKHQLLLLSCLMATNQPLFRQTKRRRKIENQKWRFFSALILPYCGGWSVGRFDLRKCSWGVFVWNKLYFEFIRICSIKEKECNNASRPSLFGGTRTKSKRNGKIDQFRIEG